ncbi:hypothetical protein HDE_08636 [Halotydeus destructor]|nr:hypothetical protein HDE_08636 [Halotydeus destructor]
MRPVVMLAWTLVAMVKTGQCDFADKYELDKGLVDEIARQNAYEAKCGKLYGQYCMKGQDRCCTGMCVTDVQVGWVAAQPGEGRCCKPEEGRVSKKEYEEWQRKQRTSNCTCPPHSSQDDALCQKFDIVEVRRKGPPTRAPGEKEALFSKLNFI